MSDTQTSSPLKGFVAGGFGGACAIVIGHPMDTVKVRLQTTSTLLTSSKYSSSKPVAYTGTLDCVQKIFKAEGLRGFYKGMGPPLVAVTPLYALSFYGFHMGKSLQQKYMRVGEELEYRHLFVAGMIGALVPITVGVPIERVKCLLQVQQQKSAATSRYKGPVDCFRMLYAEGGIRSLYRGTCAMLLRDIPSFGVYFMSYEYLQNTLTARTVSKERSVLLTLFSGGVTGVLSWTCALPADVLKSRIQTSSLEQYPNSIRSVVMDILHKEGPRTFFKGFTPLTIRAFPANAGLFLGYEFIMKLLNWVEANVHRTH